jgi:hypothetical protein
MKTREALALCLLLAAGAAGAQTLYKLVDKNGKVTYAEKAPDGFDGQVIPMTIDPNANTATLPKPQAAPAAPGKATFAEPVGVVRKTPAQAARENVDKARKALQEARDNPGPNDIGRVGTVGGGARPVPTDEYRARLEALEQAVRKAEAEAGKYDENK